MDDKHSSPRHPDEALILKKPEHSISRRHIDPDALNILYRLLRRGFTAYLTGGAVRDLMLGKTPKDFDIVTDARPGQIKKRFPNAYIIGRRFRLAHIRFKDGKTIEVATFRRDEGSGEGDAKAAPGEQKSAYGTPREDAFRRDITINALYYDAATASVLDYVGGLEDLARRRVRIIGDPAERYTEDPVRIWRVLRHAARLGFDIEEATEREIPSHRHLIADCPGARLYEEINKDLAYETRPVIEALRKYSILRYILGRIGEEYEANPLMFAKLDFLLEIEDLARQLGFQLSSEEMYALIFWPWAEPLLDETQGDRHMVLINAFENARPIASIPKKLRDDVIQLLVIVEHMFRAMRSGRIRWSLKRRSHWAQASRLFILISRGRPPQHGESFESLFREAFPISGGRKKGRR